MSDDLSPRRRFEDSQPFRRLEADVRGLLEWRRRAEPVVDRLRDRDLIAEAIAKHLETSGRGRFSRREQLIGLAAVIVGAASSLHAWLR